MTPEKVDAYLADLVKVGHRVLGGDFVGAYAGGSLALDAFQDGRSDVDVAVVCRHRLQEAAKHDLVAQWRTSALPCPAQGLKLVVYTADAARSQTCEPAFELELNDGAGWVFRQTLHSAERPASDGTF